MSVVETPVPSKGLAWMKCPFVMSMTRCPLDIGTLWHCLCHKYATGWDCHCYAFSWFICYWKLHKICFVFITSLIIGHKQNKVHPPESTWRKNKCKFRRGSGWWWDQVCWGQHICSHLSTYCGRLEQLYCYVSLPARYNDIWWGPCQFSILECILWYLLANLAICRWFG
jgi:hypothetical protein